MGYRVNKTDLENGLNSLEKKSDIALKMYCNEAAKMMEGYAKRNRPWTDRTSRARQSLNGFVEYGKNVYRICIAHGVWYGTHLESAHQKRYAILMPTVQRYANEIVKGLTKLWR